MNLEKIEEKVLEKEEFFNRVIKKLEKDLKPFAEISKNSLTFYKDPNYEFLKIIINYHNKKFTFTLPINFIWAQFLKDKNNLMYEIEDKLYLY